MVLELATRFPGSECNYQRETIWNRAKSAKTWKRCITLRKMMQKRVAKEYRLAGCMLSKIYKGQGSTRSRTRQ